MYCISFLLVVFAPFVLSNEAGLLTPCAIRDMDCLSHSTEQFLENTSKGIPEIDVKPLDPLILPGPLAYEVDKDMGLVFYFENLNVTGLRNQKISDFQMDTTAKSVLLKTKADLNIVSDFRIELQGKSFSGVYHASANVFGTARYNYDLVKDKEGVKEYFIVGPETLTCEIIEEPTVSLNQELMDALSKDPVAQSQKPAYTANIGNYRKQTFCKITEKGYETMVHNIRAVAKVLEKTAFFKDI